MLIFDAHLDLALNGVDWNRDLRMALADVRVQERLHQLTELGRQTNTITFPELRKAQVGVGIATLLARQEQAINHSFGYTTYEACYAVCYAHWAYYQAMTRAGYMTPIRTKSDLASHTERWQQQPDGTPFGYILSMECADAVLNPDNIHEWYELGLRAIGITHYGTNRYSGGTRSEAGLSADALPLLKNIEQLGIALDLTHLSDRAFWQTLDLYNGRVLASHQNARKFSDWQRQFSDEQMKAVIERGGVLGVACDAIMLEHGWVRGETQPTCTLERLVDNIDHVCQLAGNCKHSGIGSDLDGGFGHEQTPADLNSIADLQRLPELLNQRGFSDTDIAAILHGNWLRFFSEVLPT